MNRTAQQRIEKMAQAHNLKDFKWIRPQSIITGEWVRMKCTYGCPRYGEKGCCPPEVPSVAECADFFREYQSGIFFHLAKRFKDPEMRFRWYREVNKRVLDLEKEVFLSGYHKAFLFLPAPCMLCDPCQASKRECRHPYLSRPTLEAFGVDVYATARKMGYPIQVLKDYREEMNRFGLLLVE
ncbi:MAG: DUF2284 domain-containing protein [Deltaproteobacteria bacterium]|nr:DUF2284 domain-containing protein [Deltaproteobacteria bacterium]